MTAIKESWWVCGLHFPPREPWITFSGRHSSYFSRRIKNSIEKRNRQRKIHHNFGIYFSLPISFFDGIFYFRLDADRFSIEKNIEKTGEKRR